VEPLPFREMGRYPYDVSATGAPEGDHPAFPADPVHREYLETWNTRRVVGSPLDPVTKLSEGW
jgi:hypothetical protein